MDLGEAICLRRTELGMSQAALAKAAGVDPHRSGGSRSASSSLCSPRPWPSPWPFAFRELSWMGCRRSPLSGRPGRCRASGTASSSAGGTTRTGSCGSPETTTLQCSCGPPHGWTSTETGSSPASRSGTRPFRGTRGGISGAWGRISARRVTLRSQ
jgi:hypothetical protein